MDNLEQLKSLLSKLYSINLEDYQHIQLKAVIMFPNGPDSAIKEYIVTQLDELRMQAKIMQMALDKFDPE